MTLLLVDRLRKTFGAAIAAADISLQIAPGEIVGLVGPSGAGKTTLLDMIGGRLRPDRGRIRLGDDDITRAGPRAICRLGVGRTFPRAAAFPSMTVRENLQTAMLAGRGETAGCWRPARRYHRSRADLLLQRTLLLDQAERAVGVLTQASRKRLDLALALAHRPRLLLLDEPSAGLDPDERAAMALLIRTLADTDGTAVFVIEPDTDAVAALADRILVMDSGALSDGPAPHLRVA